VLLKKLKNKDIAPSVAPNNHYLGVMLPYSPIHYLIFYYFEKPVVMTSGNVSDEPIVFKNSDAFERLFKIADYFLVHDRDIHLRCDDSVYRVWRGMEYPIRRSRGYVPNSINSKWKFDEPVLACGPEQKNTFALAKENRIYLSHHIGDMDNYEVLKSFEEGIIHFKNIFGVRPKIIAYDLHPDYLSTKFALNYNDENVKKMGVQHHHAHAVSCMVENDISHPVIAITLDGTGYGIDETIWGGEILISEYDNFRRIGHFAYIEIPGGSAAIKNPWQMGLSYLYKIYKRDLLNLGLPFLDSVDKTNKLLVLNSIENRLNSPLTSSCGRLFDGIAAIAGVRNSVNYEGQAAVEFEQFIEEKSEIAYAFDLIEKDGKYIIHWETMIEQVVSDVKSKKRVSEIALKFHNGLANALLSVSEKVRSIAGINDVVLSGGVFMNIYLLSRLYEKLSKRGFNVYTHRLVPTNDGGIALGQAVIASAKVRNSSC
jgi:hydrogenase maturation protein HypF